VDFARREGLKLILLGGYDAPKAAALLKQYDIPVVVAGVHRLPQRREDPYDAAFAVPAQLHTAGVRFCIAGAAEASQARNLAYHAATAAAFGLPPAEAITLAPAEILGVADRLGSLTVGKHATLIVTDGDPLEVATHVTMAYVQGRPVDLSNRQTRLYDKYREKYRRMGITLP
jgi:imidazolonepropionase-like amidohydrolase